MKNRSIQVVGTNPEHLNLCIFHNGKQHNYDAFGGEFTYPDGTHKWWSDKHILVRARRIVAALLYWAELERQK